MFAAFPATTSFWIRRFVLLFTIVSVSSISLSSSVISPAKVTVLDVAVLLSATVKVVIAVPVEADVIESKLLVVPKVISAFVIMVAAIEVPFASTSKPFTSAAVIAAELAPLTTSPTAMLPSVASAAVKEDKPAITPAVAA
jgi:hypothetical protein